MAGNSPTSEQFELLGEPEQMTKEYNFQSGQQGVVAWENVRIILNGPANSKQIELVASGLVRPQQTMNGNESMVVLIKSCGFRIGKETVLRFPNSRTTAISKALRTNSQF